MPSPSSAGPWPSLPLASWRPTRDTLHMWSQIVGKTLLARCPEQNHWWHTAFRVSPRGLASPPAVGEGGSFDIELDLVEHRLIVRTADGRTRSMPLASRPVRTFYAEYVALLGDLGLDVHLWTRPVEVVDPIPFDQDDVHRDYDPAWAHRFFEVLQHADATLRRFSRSFVGKQSPVHFFWGSFDLAATRFSGRRAPERPGADPVTREAYSHEVISFGFWPGGVAANGIAVDEPVFYAYAAPEPQGFREAAVRQPEARYDERLSELLLPYETVRTAEDPAERVLAFCEDAYVAGATLGRWDRAALERNEGAPAYGAGQQGIHPSP